jgi:hypothetical protein
VPPKRPLGEHVFAIARSLVALQCPLAYVVLRTGVTQVPDPEDLDGLE